MCPCVWHQGHPGGTRGHGPRQGAKSAYNAQRGGGPGTLGHSLSAIGHGPWPMAIGHGPWPMADGLWPKVPGPPLSEHCKPILLPGGDRGLGCLPGVPGATHRDTWLAFGSPSRARHRGLGAPGSAPPGCTPLGGALGSSHGVFSVLTDSDAVRKFVLFRIDFDKITKLLQEFENVSTKLQVTRREGILEENIALVIRGCPPKSTVTGCTSPRHITRPSFVTTPRCTTSRRPHFQFAWLFIRPSR